MDRERGEKRPYVPLLILGLPLGVLVLAFTFVLAPWADMAVSARTKASGVVFAVIAIVGTAVADYGALRKRGGAKPISYRGFEWRTLTPAELKQLPAIIPVAALAVPLAAGFIFRNEWFGVPLGFVIACIGALALSVEAQRRSRTWSFSSEAVRPGRATGSARPARPRRPRFR